MLLLHFLPSWPSFFLNLFFSSFYLFLIGVLGLFLGTGILYNLLQEMDSTSAMALSRWLGYHLNNTRLIWPYWAHWAKDCEDVEGNTYYSTVRLNLDFLDQN